MIGSLVTTNCSCQNCCSAEYATPTPDNLPDQIAVQYSGVPSFFEPNWCSQWKTTGTDSTGTVDLFYSRYRDAAHPVLNWSGILDRLVIDGVPTDEYFKYFPEGNRQTYELTGIDESRWHEIQLFSTRVTKTRTHTFTSKFEIVAVYVARINVSTTNARCNNNLSGDPEPIDSAGSAWFADIIIEIKPGTETTLGNTVTSPSYSGGTNYPFATQFDVGTNVGRDIVFAYGLFSGDRLVKKQPNDIQIATINKQLNRYTSVRRLAFGDEGLGTFPNTIRGGYQVFFQDGEAGLFPLEEFLTSTASDHFKRKNYLVPVQMDPVTCSNSPQEFAREYIDLNRILDPANTEIIPFIAPSSPIRNNTDPLSISLTNNDMSLPYGLYKLNVLERDNTRSSPCTIGNDQRLCNPADSCCEASNFPGCPVNIPCQTAVCAIDPSCCGDSWRPDCVALAQKTPQCSCSDIPSCGSPATGDCLSVHATPYCNDAGCCGVVCGFDPSCCETEWSASCAAKAGFFCSGLGSGFTNNLTTNSPAFCNQSYYIGHGNLYKIQSPHAGCHRSYSTCGFRYVFGQLSSDESSPGEEPFGSTVFVKTPPGNINYNCAYDFLKIPACMLTERPIESVFGSSYLPETYRIEYFDGTGSWPTGAQGEGNTSMPFCFNLDESGSSELMNGLKQWCLLPQTTFPKIRGLRAALLDGDTNGFEKTTVNTTGLFATSTVLTVTPVP
jgi:hypothetical protein